MFFVGATNTWPTKNNQTIGTWAPAFVRTSDLTFSTWGNQQALKALAARLRCLRDLGFQAGCIWVEALLGTSYPWMQGRFLCHFFIAVGSPPSSRYVRTNKMSLVRGTDVFWGHLLFSSTWSPLHPFGSRPRTSFVFCPVSQPLAEIMKDSHLYGKVRCDGYVKIGASSDPANRNIKAREFPTRLPSIEGQQGVRLMLPLFIVYCRGNLEFQLLEKLTILGYCIFSHSEIEKHRASSKKADIGCRPKGSEWFKPTLTEKIVYKCITELVLANCF